MRRNILIGIALLATLSLHGQHKTEHIELLGKEIPGKDRASITIPDWENVDYIVAEAVYVCEKAPKDVRISSESEDRLIAPEMIACNGASQNGLNTSVYTTKFTGPTPKVVLDILYNSPRFCSFSLYVHRPDGNVKYIPAVGMPHLQGELVYINRVSKIPKLTEFEIPVTSESRDIQLKFGLTEFNDDDITAVFTFEFEGKTVATEIRTWFQNGKVDSYIVREVLFENVASEVDKINMTMFSAHDKKDSFIAGKVFIDMQANRMAQLSAAGN
jgi:hypothetical protein